MLFGEEFANRHKDDKIHYFVGAGKPVWCHIFLCNVLGRTALDLYKIYPQCRIFPWNVRNNYKDTPVTVFIGKILRDH